MNIIKETLIYIDNHLEDNLTVEQLAERFNYSVYYFQRIFSLSTGYGLKTYIRQRQLTKAAFDLMNSSSRIIDIAMNYGFSSAESFTKAFKNQHGVAPSVFRKEHHPIAATAPLINFDRKKEKALKVKIIELDEQLFIGQRLLLALKTLRTYPQFQSCGINLMIKKKMKNFLS